MDTLLSLFNISFSMANLLHLLVSLLVLVPVYQAARETFRLPHLGLRQRLERPAQDETEETGPLFIDVHVLYYL